MSTEPSLVYAARFTSVRRTMGSTTRTITGVSGVFISPQGWSEHAGPSMVQVQLPSCTPEAGWRGF